MNFVLLSQSRYVRDALLRRIQAAATIEMARVNAVWRLPDDTITIVGAVSDLKDDDVPMVATETIDDPADLAYHFTKPDVHGVQRPYGIILADHTQPESESGPTWLHELPECKINPGCDSYVLAPDGRRWLKEICDWVENDPGCAVDIGSGDLFPISNWTTPAAFGLAPVGPYDRAGVLSAPFTLSPVNGAYASTIGLDGVPVQLPPGYRAPKKKLHKHSRLNRCLAHARRVQQA